jgi:uncharacterized protein (DUF3084 family)
MASDLISLVLNEILKISPTVMTKYTTVQDQVLYLIFIPSVILILFIYAFAKQIVGRIVGEHKGFEYLVSITSFIYIVYSGMFGATLVPIFINWLNIAIILSLIVFVISVVFHPARGPALTKAAAETGRMIGEKITAKEKERKAIEQEVDAIKKELQGLRSEENRTLEPTAKAFVQMQIANLEAQKRRLESRL